MWPRFLFLRGARRGSVMGKEESANRKIAQNRKALRDYEVLDRYEVGIELGGTEVKSIRQGKINMLGSHARIENSQAWVYNLSISLYDHGNRFNHELTRPRRLLMHRAEIDKCRQLTEQKGLTLIPLSVYLKGGWVKLQIGVCRGKTHSDKRETLKRRTSDREAQRAMSNK